MTFPVHRMLLGRRLWTLIAFAAVGFISLVGAASWLLLIYIIQHVRIV